MEIGILVLCLLNLGIQALILRQWNRPRPQTTDPRTLTRKVAAAIKAARTEMSGEVGILEAGSTASYRPRQTPDEFAAHAERRTAELHAAKVRN